MGQAGGSETELHRLTGTRRAPAKLTLSLRITGVRDDGYHLLEAEMVTVDLADYLSFEHGDGLEVVADRLPGAIRVPTGEANLVRKALRAVGLTAQVRLHKRIPPGSGLGGGSADAAAVLRWAGIDDLALAASIGSDVPFCLVGGRAVVKGAGEVVEQLEFEQRRFVLLLPPFAMETAAVYHQWDQLGGPDSDGPNDLAPAAISLEPRLGAWRDVLGDATGVMPVLAGSGSTWYLEGSPGDLGLGGRDHLTLDGEVGFLVAVETEPPFEAPV